ncbi:hypothetical protein Q3O43_21760 [Rhodococcus aetherivorans]|uniref:hypothetical protein n=1 Tax=Rhodococcus aetherivorans TaxID=191292 RepID=UPI00045C7FCC|nr:hypothetical protein [Rhodococcus aetherivorans]KDE11636.1 hypothetical protein N505_0118595 [Rhodococcus aetherivorans]WKW97637.1 hypothetical protein Q3O43_21760 [Rhodococcus aetherivorans]
MQMITSDQSTDKNDRSTAEDGVPPREQADSQRSGFTVRLQPGKILIGGLVVALCAAVALLGWQVSDKASELDRVRTEAAALERAEQAALEYATGAAEMDFRDLQTWRTRLTTGTSPELSERLTRAATSMEQIIVPLQWTSTAQPITAKAEAGPDGIYTVDCFVSVVTKNAQAPEGIQSTATYKLSMDSRDEWKITEISGVGSALGDGNTPR